MVQYCCVPLCKSFGGLHFPKDKVLRDKWRVAVKKAVSGNKTKLWEPSKHDVVCHKHFLPEDYTTTAEGKRKRLIRGAVPSVFHERMTKTPVAKYEADLNRKKRYEKRTSTCTRSSIPVSTCSDPDISNLCNEIEIITENKIATIASDSDQFASTQVQCEILTDKSGQYSIENYKDKPNAVKYYTGFDDYGHFMMFFHVLGPAVNHLNYKCQKIEPKNQLFLTLMKLRLNKEDYELSLFFCVSQPTISKVIETWINFMYCQLKEINTWPTRDIITQYMPEDFKRKHSTTRVILDATEVPIQKPSNVSAQSSTFSSYKHKNTLKTMIGVSSRGLVTFVSDSYAGTASDRQIIERSDLCKKDLFNKKDSIMADRGIMVQDLFANKDVKVNTPTMLAGKSQLEPETVVKDRRIASKRIHVERVIGLAKNFKILSSELPMSKVNLGSRIAFICFKITNFHRCIVGRLA